MALYRIHVVWFLVCYATSLAQRCRRTDSIEDYRLGGHVISSDKENSVWSCFQACKTKRECRSLNYNLETFICEINNRTKREKPDKFVPLEGSVYVDNPFRARLGTEKDLPGLSCKDINDSHEDSASGVYWIDPTDSNDPFTVFCDMKTDGGGWTLVAQTVVKNSMLFPPMIRKKNFRMITNYSSGIMRIDVSAIRQLKQLIKFTQLRYFCRKESTGRTFHIMTKNDPHGERAVHYLTEDPGVQPRACGSFVTLADDNSFLAANCDKWGNNGTSSECDRWGSYKHKGTFRVYNDPIFWEGKYHINLKTSILACDDSYSNTAPLSRGDKWQLFVR